LAEVSGGGLFGWGLEDDPQTLVSHLAVAPSGGRFAFPEDATALFDLYDDLVEATGGALDPLVGRDLELLGYDAAYTLTPADDDVRSAE
jgi:thiamine biosynthesis lipoprotein